MKTKNLSAINLILTERQEQIEKHGYTNQFIIDNPNFYENRQITKLVSAVLSDLSYKEFIDSEEAKEWDLNYICRTNDKPYQEKLIICGALILAELDRVNAKK